MYRGTLHVVSCRELQTPPSKEESFEKANLWWRAKQAEIDGYVVKSELDGTSAKIKDILDRAAPSGARELETLVEQGEAAKKLLTILEASSVKDCEGSATTFPDGSGLVPMPNPEAVMDGLQLGVGLPHDIVDKVLSHGLYDELSPDVREPILSQLDRKIKATKLASEPERSIGKQVELWVSTERQRVRAGKLSLSRANMNVICLHHFRDWIGTDTSVEMITETKWLEFHGWLSAKLDGGAWGLAHCDRIFSVTKRFVRFLWELRLIDLPRNLDNRNLSFNQPAKKIEVFTLEEVRKLYAIVSGQSKLHMLLMLNCGFIGQDINDLRQDEVDWVKGLIKRKRSKTEDRDSVPEVKYKLWACTFDLLKKHRSNDTEIVLFTVKGNRWITERQQGQKYSRSDCIGRNLDYWLGRAEIARSPKQLRATAASKLGENSQYKFYAQYFLGQAPQTVADRHYVKPNDEEFFAALMWLERELLG